MKQVWVSFTSKYGKKEIWFDVNRVLTVSSATRRYTAVTLTTEHPDSYHTVYVRETPEEVIQRIAEAKKSANKKEEHDNP